MRLWKSIISCIGLLALTACGAGPGAFSVRAASIDAAVLSAQIAWQPDADVLDALDHGIALDFIVTIGAQAPSGFGWDSTLASVQRHLQLRYYPLSRQYQLLDEDLGRSRSYASRTLAVAAIEDLRLPLPDWQSPLGTQRFSLAIALDRSTLPGALRLAALLRPSWWIGSKDYVWVANAAA
jgi:hypothetical protein